MKIVGFERDETNAIVAILEDGTQKTLSFDFVAQNKPQVGDELEVEASE